MRRSSLALLTCLVALPVHAVGAQIIRGERFGLRAPQTWVSGTYGWQEGWTVTDGRTNSRWELSDTQQYGGSIERVVSSGISLGLRAVTSRPTVRYAGTSTPTDAELRVTQALGVVHVTTGRQLRSVFELGVGATVYSNVKAPISGGQVAPATDSDFLFVFVYGLGYSFSPTFHVDIVQDLGTSVHQKTGLAAGEDRSARIRSTRLVARYGIGG